MWLRLTRWLAPLAACCFVIASCSSARTEAAQDNQDSGKQPDEADTRDDALTAFSVGAADQPPDTPSLATATLVATSGSQVEGRVIFDPIEGGLIIRVEATGLGEGVHGMHVHEVGDCSSSDGTSAGPHFDPDGNKLGDLDSIEGDPAGEAFVDVLAPGLTLWGETDVIGRSIVLHDPEDADVRIACGLIEAA